MKSVVYFPTKKIKLDFRYLEEEIGYKKNKIKQSIDLLTQSLKRKFKKLKIEQKINALYFGMHFGVEKGTWYDYHMRKITQQLLRHCKKEINDLINKDLIRKKVNFLEVIQLLC